MDTTVIEPAVRATHAALSPRNVAFLEAMAAEPRATERATYSHLDVLREKAGYPLQSWPIFVDRSKLEELSRLNIELAALVKAVPVRVLGNDIRHLADFYGLEIEHAKLVSTSFAKKRWLEGCIGRSDFFHTDEGFRCLEFNMASNIGGWQSSYWGSEILTAGPTAQFLADQGLEPRSHPVIRNLLSYLLRGAIGRFKTSEINIAFLVPEEATEESIVHLQAATSKIFEAILEGLGGKIQGSFCWCKIAEVERQGSHVVHQGRRLHVVLDGYVGFAGVDITRSWLMGGVELFNGPATPVLTDKRNLALLWEHKDTELFDDDERRVIEAAVPWTRRLSAKTWHPQAPEPLGPEEILARRHELVLKPGGELGGKDVHLGPGTGESLWREVVERAFADGSWIVQTLQKSRPHFFQAGTQGAISHDVVWSFFVFGDRFGGVDLRMAPQDTEGVVNASRGATIGSVFEVED